MSRPRAFLSIGDVLSLLKADFPDVTISKIRFLESQGLLDPERTPSGYRKFYDEDVERLRWILRQQRENFLPLKVIKGRLEGRGEQAEEGPQGRFELEEEIEERALIADRQQAIQVARGHSGDDRQLPAPSRAAAVAVRGGSTDPGPTHPTSQPAAQEPEESEDQDSEGLRRAREALGLAAPRGGGSASQARRSLGLKAAPVVEVDELPGDDEGLSMTVADLASASGLSGEDIEELLRFGLLAGRNVAGTTHFDDDALAVARLAAGFSRFGIEPRHIRSYRLAAEREVGLFEQVIAPILKQRNPEARKQARQALADLSKLGQQMRTAMVRSVLRGLDKP